ncbi:hypothetical protein ACMFMF_011236 [Clarireedia jacksonii]
MLWESGPVVRVAPSEVSFTTPSSFDTIYGTPGDAVFEINGAIKGLIGTVGNLQNSVSNIVRKEDRQELRVLITSTLTELSRGTGEELLHGTFWEILKKHNIGKNEEKLRLDELLSEITWVYGSRLALGITSKIEDLSMRDHVDWLDRFFCYIEYWLCFVGRRTAQAYMKWLFKSYQVVCFFTGQETNVPPAMDYTVFSKEIISEYPVNHLIKLREAVKKTKGGLYLNDSILRQNAIITWISIWGSSHLPLMATFYYILQHPRCLQKLEEEIIAACKTVDDVNDKELACLEYLNACINESLRLAGPFTSGILQRVSRGAFVDGIYIPEGFAVSTDTYVMARSKLYWRKPEEFIPERWLEQFPEDNQKASRPFLIGTRACPGRHLALQMFRLLLAKMIYSYKLDLINKEFDIDKECEESFFWTGLKMNVRIEPRFKVAAV